MYERIFYELIDPLSPISLTFMQTTIIIFNNIVTNFINEENRSETSS